VYHAIVETETENQNSTYDAALRGVKERADIVVLTLGISKLTETEGIDREQTGLPGLQNPFALDVLKIAKEKDIPAVLVLVNGGTLSVDDLMPKRTYHSNLPACYQSRAGVPASQLPRQYAVVEAYNPSFGAQGIAEALFGIGPVSWGRMVTTMYPKKFAETHRVDQYDLAAGDGLTYRYHTGEVLATFGEGMPHEEPARSNLSCKLLSVDGQHEDHDGIEPHEKAQWKLHCVASNTMEERALSSLAMVFVRASEAVRAEASYPVPQRALKAFQRVMVGPLQSTEFEISICVNDIMLVNEEGHREALPGRHFDLIDVWDGWDAFQSFPVSLPGEHHPDGITVESY
jgi:hypothetical protein